MGRNNRPVNSIDFLDDLPAFYSLAPGDDDSFRRFLMQFETVFEDLQSAIVGNLLTLTYRGAAVLPEGQKLNGYALVVDLFDAGHLGYPKGALVQIPGNPDTTLLSEPIPADGENLNIICVSDIKYLDKKFLKPGEKLLISTGSGLAGLTSIREMQPANFRYPGNDSKLDYLQYIASWVGLPLRPDKLLSWNRRFLREAVKLGSARSTLPGLTRLMNEWHQEEVDKDRTVITDLISPENGVDTVFRVGESRIGIDTVIGEAAPGHFHVHLTADPTDVGMRKQKNLVAMDNAARLMLDLEKPANTEYTLHIHAHTMQLAPDAPIAPYKKAPPRDPKDIPEGELSILETNKYARIGITTLLWGE